MFNKIINSEAVLRNEFSTVWVWLDGAVNLLLRLTSGMVET